MTFFMFFISSPVIWTDPGVTSPGDLRHRFAKFIANISRRHNQYVSLSMLYCLKHVLHEWCVSELQPLDIYLRKLKSISMYDLRTSTMRLGLGKLVPKYREESEQDKGGVATLNSTRRLWLVCQNQVSRTGTSNLTPRYLWDAITCPCPWYLLSAHKASSIEPISHSSDRPISAQTECRRHKTKSMSLDIRDTITTLTELTWIGWQRRWPQSLRRSPLEPLQQSRALHQHCL